MAVIHNSTNLFFNRDTKVYAVQYTGTSTANVWQLPVLAGYSFSQATNSSDVTVNEMTSAVGVSRRGQVKFNNSLAPADWSVSLYARPTLSTTVRAPEEILWNSLLSETVYNATLGTGGVAVSTATINTTAGTTDLAVTAAPTGGTYFKQGDRVKVTGLAWTGGIVPTDNTYVVSACTNTVVTIVNPTGSTAVTPTSARVYSSTFASTATELDFLPTSSNKSKLGTFDLYFVLGATKTATLDTYTSSDPVTIYKIANCCVNEAKVDFAIDGITTIAFSGMGTAISEQPSWTFTGAIQNPDQSVSVTHTLISNGVTSTSNMIRNRLTALSITSASTNIGIGAKTYAITLTGGSFTISNNMNFLTPEALGVVNVPLGHIAGSRSISGSFTCYADEVPGGSLDLYQDLLTATSLVTNKFALQFFVGGKGTTAGYPASPGVMIDMGQCHLEVPAVKIEDVIGFDVNFTALPTTISGTDELTKIRYVS
jgi:hypothetical protein